MNTTATPPTGSALPLAVTGDRYPEHFSPAEFRFRWIEATGLDTDLPPRANHLAARIVDLYVDGHATTASIEQLVELTRMSPSTVSRAIGDLVRRGWIAPRGRGVTDLVLLMPDRGIDLLLARRARRDWHRGRSTIIDHWTAVTFARINQALGTAYGTPTAKTPPHLRARIRSIIAHQVDPATETGQLIASLTEHPPADLHDPVGFLLHRAAEHVRARPHLSHRQPANTTADTGTVDIGPIIRTITDKLAAPDRVRCSEVVA